MAWPWTWTRVTGAVFIFAALFLFVLNSHSRMVIPLNTIGLVFLTIYYRKYGKRVNAPFDHDRLHLF